LYDGELEQETMVQCLACDDWFHESCLNLRERLPLRERPLTAPSPPSSQSSNPATAPADASTNDTEAKPEEAAGSGERYWDYEDEEEEEDPSIPKALISATDYDTFVCGECLVQSPMLLKWAGSAGARMVVRKSSSEPWYVYPEAPPSQEPAEVKDEIKENGSAVSGQKRTYQEMEGTSQIADTRAEGEPATKKVRRDSETCSAPTPDPPIQALLDRIIAKKGPYLEGEGLQGSGDVFFTPGWRERWCRCKDLASKPYLDEAEDVYELPEDPDAGLSFEELGLKALQNLPRERVIDGLRAYQTMQYVPSSGPFSTQPLLQRAPYMKFLRRKSQREDEVPTFDHTPPPPTGGQSTSVGKDLPPTPLYARYARMASTPSFDSLNGAPENPSSSRFSAINASTASGFGGAAPSMNSQNSEGVGLGSHGRAAGSALLNNGNNSSTNESASALRAEPIKLKPRRGRTKDDAPRVVSMVLDTPKSTETPKSSRHSRGLTDGSAEPKPTVSKRSIDHTSTSKTIKYSTLNLLTW
ncbi:5890_t:CDS:2, partial [Acaulospora colombiana]